MQQHIKNDLLYLLRVLEAAEKIILYSSPFNQPQDFFEANDQKDFNACLNLLSQVGEQCNKLSKTLIEKYPEIDWVSVKGLRNRIVHDYTGIDLYIIFETVKKSIPELPAVIVEMIRTETGNGNFDREELSVAETSPYLRHIDFSLFK